MPSQCSVGTGGWRVGWRRVSHCRRDTFTDGWTPKHRQQVKPADFCCTELNCQQLVTFNSSCLSPYFLQTKENNQKDYFSSDCFRHFLCNDSHCTDWIFGLIPWSFQCVFRSFFKVKPNNLSREDPAPLFVRFVNMFHDVQLYFFSLADICCWALSEFPCTQMTDLQLNVK